MLCKWCHFLAYVPSCLSLLHWNDQSSYGGCSGFYRLYALLTRDVNQTDIQCVAETEVNRSTL